MVVVLHRGPEKSGWLTAVFYFQKYKYRHAEWQIATLVPPELSLVPREEGTDGVVLHRDSEKSGGLAAVLIFFSLLSYRVLFAFDAVTLSPTAPVMKSMHLEGAPRTLRPRTTLSRGPFNVSA